MFATRPKLFLVPRKRPAAELLAERLARIPTGLGRIVYTGGCRGEDGRYAHDGLAMTHDAGIVHRVLAAAHERLFREWLALPFVAQDADVWAYLTGQDRRKVLRVWPDLQPWQRLAAPGATERERQRWSAVFHAIFDDAIAREDQNPKAKRRGKGSETGNGFRNDSGESEVSGRRRGVARAGDRVRAAGAAGLRP